MMYSILSTSIREKVRIDMISLLQFIGMLLLCPIVAVAYIYFMYTLIEKLRTLKTKTAVLIIALVGVVGVSLIVFG